MTTIIARRRVLSTLLGTAVLGSVLVVVAVLVSGFGTALADRTLVTFLVNATLVLALQAFMGNSGIVTFGHVAFMGVGAYVTALLTIPVPIKAQQLESLPAVLAHAELGLVGSVIVSAIVAALVAAILGGGLVRMRESAMAMATLALLVVAHTVFQNWTSMTRGTIGLFGIPENTTVWVALVGAVGALTLTRLYKESRPGQRLRASREDPVAAGSSGVNVVRERYVGWILSAAVMGAGGSLWAQSVLAFDPNQFFFDMTFATLAMLVIGGQASVTGAIAGAAIVTFVSDTLSRAEQALQAPGLVQVALALLIIVTLVLRPEGLMGRLEIEELGGKLARLFARRRRTEPAATEAMPAPSSLVPAGTATEDAPAGSVRWSEEDVALEAERITKLFAGLVALRDVDLAVRHGEILGLIGPNGSGKTTLLNVLSGTMLPTHGRVVLGGDDVTGSPAHRIARRGVARTFQNIRLFSHLTVRENVEVAGGAALPEEELEGVLREFDLLSVQGELTANLAYGIQRRVEIVRAVVRHPNVLLLDEPGAGMNEAESDELLANVLRVRDHLGCAMVVVDHDLRLIMQLCERIQVLNEGRTIAEGEPEAVGRDPAVVEAYLGREGSERRRVEGQGGHPPDRPGSR